MILNMSIDIACVRQRWAVILVSLSRTFDIAVFSCIVMIRANKNTLTGFVFVGNFTGSIGVCLTAVLFVNNKILFHTLFHLDNDFITDSFDLFLHIFHLVSEIVEQ